LEPPRPPESLTGWLKTAIDAPERTPEFKTDRVLANAAGEATQVSFEADVSRVSDGSRWLTSWQVWAEAERPAREAFKVFEKLYALHGHLQREAERFELMAGDGLLCWRRSEGSVRHPILLQRLVLEFDAAAAVFTISQTEHAPELYTALLRHIPDVPGRILAELRSELEAGAFQPFAQESTPFFQGAATRLSSSGQFVDGPSGEAPGPFPRISRDPVFFLRQRALGFASVLDGVLQDLQAGGGLPPPLKRIVGIDTPAGLGIAPGVPRAPHEILFTKPANAEQFQIADQLGRHGSVLVQGPPGTGKTHTIANVIGDLLAQGKRVLVTSHTTKALSVLRDKVVGPLQPLCVSVLESDLTSRSQLESSIAEIVRRLGDNPELLESEAGRRSGQRDDLLKAIDECEAKILAIREGEYRDIVIGDEPVPPSSAARTVAAGAIEHDWIPEPVMPGAAMPVAETEVYELYRTNEALSGDDERELDSTLPELESLVDPDLFDRIVAERRHLHEAGEVKRGVDLWAIEWTDQVVRCHCRTDNRVAATALLHEIRCGHCKSPLFPRFTEHLDGSPVGYWQGLLTRVQEALNLLDTDDRFQLAALAAGASSDDERRPWEVLVKEIHDVSRRAVESLEAQIQHGPKLGSEQDLDAQLGIARALLGHAESGGRLGTLSLIFRPKWRGWLSTVTVDSGKPHTTDHLQALVVEIELRQARKRLVTRWERFAVPWGAPTIANASHVEQELVPRTVALKRCLTWDSEVWKPLEDELQQARLRWSLVLASISIDDQSHAEVRRRKLALGKLEELLVSHRARQRWMEVSNLLGSLASVVIQSDANSPSEIVKGLREALVTLDGEAYRETYSRLELIRRKQATLLRRRTLLNGLRNSAPGWADAISGRVAPHDRPDPPGPPATAWRWRQLHEELENRSRARLEEVEDRLEDCKDRLTRVTASIVEGRAWAKQIRRIQHSQRMALVGWADTVRRIGRGTGKRAPQLLNKAGELMRECRGAVPVWIMPLSRVADSFAASTRFDVVIVDEASQSDVMALLALYMGDSTIIVGDNEQVSPEAVGQDVTEVQRLIDEHLTDIPNGHLYDGKTSIYDLARQSFGGAIRLREHFRCLPEIIQFSNDLSYEGDIQPLRDDSGVRVRPPVVVVHVPDATSRNKRNKKEVEVVTSLIVAALDEPDYVEASVGVISMVGEEQAYDVATELSRRLTPAKLERHRVMCGNPAQFQGDERDVVFLSMVDAPEGAVLSMRSDDRFKKRFNVAASRAKDQMWVVHSLAHETDLKAGDLRRLLIEHAIDSNARLAEWRRLRARVDRRAGDFEERVLQELLQRNFSVRPQYSVGAYVLDFVVESDSRRVALECDGDRYHTLENLQEDMARQAVLERRGWRFVRVRGTEFFRRPSQAMDVVCEKLERLGIRPSQQNPGEFTPTTSALVERVTLRAAQLRQRWYGESAVRESSEFAAM
jgi:very-short-patch-repair endonuclease